MSLLFCHECATLLGLPTNDSTIKCLNCGLAHPTSLLEGKPIHTKSRQTLFEDSIRLRNHLNKVLLKDSDQENINALLDRPVESGATIQERCPKCNHHEMTFHTMQLRSADEGQTVFYSCPKCKHKYSLNS